MNNKSGSDPMTVRELANHYANQWRNNWAMNPKNVPQSMGGIEWLEGYYPKVEPFIELAIQKLCEEQRQTITDLQENVKVSNDCIDVELMKKAELKKLCEEQKCRADHYKYINKKLYGQLEEQERETERLKKALDKIEEYFRQDGLSIESYADMCHEIAKDALEKK